MDIMQRGRMHVLSGYQEIGNAQWRERFLLHKTNSFVNMGDSLKEDIVKKLMGAKCPEFHKGSSNYILFSDSKTTYYPAKTKMMTRSEPDIVAGVSHAQEEEMLVDEFIEGKKHGSDVKVKKIELQRKDGRIGEHSVDAEMSHTRGKEMLGDEFTGRKKLGSNVNDTKMKLIKKPAAIGEPNVEVGMSHAWGKETALEKEMVDRKYIESLAVPSMAALRPEPGHEKNQGFVIAEAEESMSPPQTQILPMHESKVQLISFEKGGELSGLAKGTVESISVEKIRELSTPKTRIDTVHVQTEGRQKKFLFTENIKQSNETTAPLAIHTLGERDIAVQELVTVHSVREDEIVPVDEVVAQISSQTEGHMGLPEQGVDARRSIEHNVVKILPSATEDSLFPSRVYARLMELLSLGNSSPSRQSENLESDGLFIPEGHQFLLRVGEVLLLPPSEEEWEQANVIFLMDNVLSTLPERPNCPKLAALFLQRNYRLREIPTSFFDLMPSLKMLNLSKTRIKSLPKSLSKLKELQIFILRHCERLAVLPSEVGSLECLEMLDLQGTEINKLPDEIGELASLKHLVVSFYGSINCTENRMLPHELLSSEILSRLHALETLSLAVYPGDERWNMSVKFVAIEVSNLSQLTYLRFSFPEVEVLEQFLQRSTAWNSQHLTEFNFVVGCDVKRLVSRVPHGVELDYGKQGQCLRFVNGKKIPDAIVQVLTRTTAFYLDHHLNDCSVSSFGASSINGLKLCIVSDCPKIKTIVDCKELTTKVFPCLEHLSIHCLQNLLSIWKGIVPDGSFASLRILSVCTCPKLKCVFSCSMLQFVPNLEELVVEDCAAIEEIIFRDETIENGAILQLRLKNLRLHYLPELVNIWKGDCPSLERISFYTCPNLKKLCIDSNAIKEIKAEKRWWDALEWEDTALHSRFQDVFTPICDDDL